MWKIKRMMEHSNKSLYQRLYKTGVFWIFFVLLAAIAFLQGCGGSSDGGSEGSTTTTKYDPSRDYYDQLWNVAKGSLTPDMTEAEVAEVLVRWIVNNSTNARWVPEDSAYRLPDGALGSDDSLLPFHGLCGSRSLLFQYFGLRAGLTVSVFNMYNFSGPGHGHTCTQVYYEGDWHFFDVTYAGVFKINNKVLSFAEMRKDPISALEGMIVFEPEKTIRDYYSSGLPVNNKIRMRNVYTEDALANAISTSFLDSGNLVPLEVQFDLELVPIELGDPDGTTVELDADGTSESVSCPLGLMLGHVFDNFEPILIFRNTIPGQTYKLGFYIYRSTAADLMFRVTSMNDVEIISGKELITSVEMLRPEASVAWEIVFRAKAEEASFKIHHECESGEGLFLNQITVEGVD
jgi:hypothetical protein